MDSPNWNGFFPRALYGGLAFWLNLLLLNFSDMSSYSDIMNQHKIDSTMIVFGGLGIILLTGYLLEQVSFFAMKKLKRPVKWYYEYTAEMLNNGKTASDLEIENDHRIDKTIGEAWRNRFTIALINTEISFAFFFSLITYIYIWVDPKICEKVLYVISITVIYLYLIPLMLNGVNFCKYNNKKYTPVPCCIAPFTRLTGYVLDRPVLKCIFPYLLVLGTVISLIIFLPNNFKCDYQIFYKVSVLNCGVVFLLVYEAERLNEQYGEFIAKLIAGKLPGIPESRDKT